MKPGPVLRLNRERLLGMITFVSTSKRRKAPRNEDLKQLKGGVKVGTEAMEDLLHDALKGRDLFDALNEAVEVHEDTFLGKLLARIRDGKY